MSSGIFPAKGAKGRRQQSSGSTQLQISLGDLPPGIYFYRLSADGQLLNVGKMVIW